MNMHNLYINDTLDILNGQDIVLDSKWTDKKRQSTYLSEIFESLGMVEKAIRIKECGSFIEFSKFENNIKLTNANFCKTRLCPMCNWRRSLKIFAQLSKIMDSLKNKDYQFLFLTLTVKNCKDFELKDTIDNLMNGWNKFNQRKNFKESILGYYRALEITVNLETNEYHPHFHVILAVSPSYFKKTGLYIKNKDWAKMWQESVNIDYLPIVDIRKVKSKTNNKKDLGSVVAETAKYTVKDSDYLTGDKEKDKQKIWILENALSKRRLIAMGGVFKEVHKKINLDDPIDGELTDFVNEIVADAIFKFNWHGNGYVRNK